MQRQMPYVIALSLIVTSAGSPGHAQKKANSKVGSGTPVPAGVPRGVDPGPGGMVIEPEPVQPRTALAGQPRMDGSTTAVLLGQLLAARALGLNGQVRRMASELRWPGAASSAGVVFPLDSPPALMAQYQSWLQREPRYTGTNGAYMSLINNESDLILVAREPSADELKAAQEKGVGLDARPIALDAFVFLVNSGNPVSTLTLEQIRGIYTDAGANSAAVSSGQAGRITNWQQVGGANLPVRAFTRNRNSGSEELMEKFVMQGRKIITGGDRMLMTMGGPIEGVSRDPNSIAYSVYYYEHVMSPYAQNKLLSVNGVAPTAENIARRRYPLTAEFYAVTLQGVDKNTPAARLRDWLFTEDGQKLITESGYVTLKSPVR